MYNLVLLVSANEIDPNSNYYDAKTPLTPGKIIPCNDISISGKKADSKCHITLRVQKQSDVIDVTPLINSKYFTYSVSVDSFSDYLSSVRGKK